MHHCEDCVDCVFVVPEEAGRLEGEEDQSERKREEKQRARGPEGQRPLIPNKVCVQHVKQKVKRRHFVAALMLQTRRCVTQPNAVFLPQPSLDLSRDKTSPEKAVTSPKTSPVSPGEEPTNDQRSLPPAHPVIQEEETTERKSPPASAKSGMEAADPVSQGTVM